MRGMRQRWLFAVAVVAGCGTDPDPRELTFEVVATEVLRPSCGQVQCHSKTTRIEGYAFDTVQSSREAFQMKLSVTDLPNLFDGKGFEQMPFDAPLTEEDRALVDAWIAAGAPGL
jgi:hypothetical protein